MRPVLVTAVLVAAPLAVVDGPVGAGAVVLAALLVAALTTRHRHVGPVPAIALAMYVLAAADVAAVVLPAISMPIRGAGLAMLLVAGMRTVGLLGDEARRVAVLDGAWSAMAVVVLSVDASRASAQTVPMAMLAVGAVGASLWVQFAWHRRESSRVVLLLSVAMVLVLARATLGLLPPVPWADVGTSIGLVARLLVALALAHPHSDAVFREEEPSEHDVLASRAIVATVLLVVAAVISRVREIVGVDAMPVVQMLFPMAVLVTTVVRVQALYRRSVEDNDRLRRSALREPITDTLSEQGVVAMLEDERPVGSVLLAVEIDGLRSLLRRLDTTAGADLLRSVAGRLEEAAGMAPMVARCGPDEFVLVSAGDPVVLAGAVDATLGEALTLSAASVSVNITVRIGWAVVDEESPAAALGRARFAADEAQPGDAVAFAAAQRERYDRQRTLMREFPTALREGQVVPHYQAIVCVETGRILSFEVLARWTHPVHGPISPGEFIPLAESSGAIVHLGGRLLAEACDQLAAWRRLRGHEDLGITVNLSPRQLSDPDLERRVATALTDAGLPAGAVTLELTEGMLLDLTTGGSRLDALRSLGVGIAVDDFGTGYSSLSYIDRLRPDLVKVDRHFTQSLTTSDGELAWGIFRLLSELDVPVVGEGVEDEETLAMLQSVGCDRWQGYLHSRPGPATDATALLTSAPTAPRPVAVAASPPASPPPLPMPSRRTIASLVRPAVVVDDSCTWRSVDMLFHDDARLRTVVVRRADGGCTLLSGGEVRRTTTGRDGVGHSLHGNEPLAARLGAPTRPFDPDTSIVDAVAVAMARPADVRYDDLLVDDGEHVGLVSVSGLLAELADDFGQLAIRDDLTGLPNRRHFIVTLEEWLDRGERVGALYVDLDSFKPINDLHGHAAGDAVLTAVGTRLRACARSVDVVARLGGDEFAVAMRDPTDEVLRFVAERIQRALAPPVPWKQHELIVRPSIGQAVGRWPSPDELIVAADSSMYEAKRDGGNGIGSLRHGTRIGTPGAWAEDVHGEATSALVDDGHRDALPGSAAHGVRTPAASAPDRGSPRGR